LKWRQKKVILNCVNKYFFKENAWFWLCGQKKPEKVTLIRGPPAASDWKRQVLFHPIMQEEFYCIKQRGWQPSLLLHLNYWTTLRKRVMTYFCKKKLRRRNAESLAKIVLCLVILWMNLHHQIKITMVTNGKKLSLVRTRTQTTLGKGQTADATVN